MSEIKKPNISRTEAVNRLWRIPNLTYKLDDTQREMYVDLMDINKPKLRVVACARGLGKSYMLLVIAIECCLRKAGATVKYVAPTIKDLKNIVIPNFNSITADCPPDLIPKYNKADGKIVFTNGSEIQLGSAENGADSIRGVTADLCLVDEAGFCKGLSYLCTGVLLPSLRPKDENDSSRNKKLILASTPSKSNDHDFIGYMKQAEFEGHLLKKTVYDNGRIIGMAKADGYNDVNQFVQDTIAINYVGGVNSTGFKREYLCSIISEETDMVVPEFNTELQGKIIQNWEQPLSYDGYVSMDIGFRDLTVVLFAYYDFVNAKLVVCDELVLSGAKMLTSNLATEVNAKETVCFSEFDGSKKEPYLRISDNNNLILLQDLSVQHNIHFRATAKDNLDAAINAMRYRMASENIIITPNCKTLISHLKGATWNKQRTTFDRAGGHHYDAVSSLIYLVRNVNWNRNPFPSQPRNPEYHYNNSTKQERQAPTTNFERHMVDTFKLKLGRNRRRW